MAPVASPWAALQQVLRDSVHGGVLKSLSLLARLLFFVLVVPVLVAGELGVYMYISSTALVIAIVAIFGLNDELPRVIRGDVNKAHGYFRWSALLNWLTLLLLLAMFLRPGVWLGILLFAVTTIASRFAGGVVRSVDPANYERLQNLPWILFIFAAVALRLDNAFDLLIARSVSMGIVTWASLHAVSRRGEKSGRDMPVPLPVLARRALSHGVTKLVSNLSLLGIMRGPVMLPVWLGIETDLDPIAFAVAVGEVIVQFGLIPANRAYAKWCRQAPERLRDWHYAINLSLVLAAVLAALSVLLMVLVDAARLMPEQAPDLSLLVQALAMYALVAAFYSLRYLIWARGVMEYWVVILSVGMLGACSAIIGLLDSQLWFACFAAVSLGGFVTLAISSRRYFVK